jgi:hypothetical protein
VRAMMQYAKNKEKIKRCPSLYDAFKLGDRVKRRYKDENGKSKEYMGIILAIDKENIEVSWDTLNGKYRPDNMDVTFTNCSVNNIFKGNKHYSPIKKE